MNKYAARSQIMADCFHYPFRIYFLLSAALLPLAALLWTLPAHGLWPQGWAAPLTLHAYAFLNIIGGAAFAGFLFTAMPEWTHDGRPLAAHARHTLALWLTASVLSLWWPPIGAWLMLPFWLYLSVFSAWLAWQAHDERQLNLLLMLLTVTALNTCYALSGELFWLKQLAHTFMIGVVLVMFRIGKAIGQKALQDTPLAHCVFVPNVVYRNLAAWFLYAYITANIWLEQPLVSAWLSVAVGLVMLGRLREWHYPLLWEKYYIRWYYLTLVFIGTGYLWQGVAVLLHWGSVSAAFHLIMLGGYVLMLMQVFSIAGAVHSSLPLHYPYSSRLGLALIAAAALSRALGGNGSGSYTLLVFYLPAVLLLLAFWLYIPVYARLFIANPPLPVSPHSKG